MKAKRTWAAYTHRGSCKPVNQDAFIIRKLSNGSDRVLFCAVADGVGGHGEGRMASQLVVKELSKAWAHLVKTTEVRSIDIGVWYERLFGALTAVNGILHEEYASSGVLSATTCSFCLMDERNMHIAHIGDSRIFSVKKTVVCLTEDHVVKGKGVLTKCLGARPLLEADKVVRLTDPAEKIILATDGFYKLVDKDMMKITQSKSAQKSLDHLIEEVTKKYRRDNLTLIICHI
ncbi:MULTISPECIES: PP2C family serine/threonine-protein phosphatase [unclassified Fusibacter]|uniref:PP2C family protein-serine/threonine phosphatase n=1 Tax=unclassified Fusibacter TaxID=2624464 RepID=UPI0013E91720|nr:MULTISPECIES: PP2C family serine/threonine-protein phosphatase [unclassified Fusibacter]MCK8060827.1 serine/threonine-protein phosphatase [Fusibacter sp. A2]NPE23123.1 serine/threonine-protein phosphatase [Fusibacter sp. A1]